MVSSRVSSTGGGGFRVTVDPDPRDVAKDIARQINRPMKRVVGKLHKELGQMPVQAIKARSRRAPRGQVRIGRFIKASAAQSGITVVGGRGAADFAGQLWGSKRYSRFAPYTGGPYEDTYVVGDVLRDELFMESFGKKYADGLSDLLKTVWSGKQ